MSRRWNLSGLNSLVSRFLPKFEPAGQDDCGCREDQEHGIEDPLTNHANSSVFSLTATRDVFITSAETSRDKTAGANVGPADDRSTLGLFRVGRITERTDRWRPLWVRHTFVARQGWIRLCRQQSSGHDDYAALDHHGARGQSLAPGQEGRDTIQRG